MDILYIANLVPYPLDGGGKIKTFASIQALSREHTVDLLCFYEKENLDEAEKVLKQYCRNVIMLPIRVTTSENYGYILLQAVKSLLTSLPLCVYKYKQKGMEDAIQSIVAKNSYQIVYFNLLQIYSYRELIRKLLPKAKIVLDTQNCETQIFRRYAKESKNLIKKFYLLLEATKLQRFESASIQDADKLILLSTEDRQILEKMVGKPLACEIIPIAVQEPDYVKMPQTIASVQKPCILFLGTLTWAPNNEGMIWFMENVMPQLQDTLGDFSMFIVGKNPSDTLKALTGQYKNVTVTGYVDSVVPYFEKCDFMVVPLFVGSGQRVKIIESFSRGMPVVATSIGAEGLHYTDGQDILIANTAEEFLECIQRICNADLRKKLSVGGRKLYEKYYSVKAVSRQLVAAVNDLQ